MLADASSGMPGGETPSSQHERAYSQPAVPSLSLPKGGGAIRGIGETFTVAGATGTGRLELPLPLPAGRGGLFAGLRLGYDSGAGNGPFGLGWSLTQPAITRRTDAGLPRYLDDADSDDLLLSGAETLVPRLDGAGQPLRRPARLHGRDYRVATYLPRTEGGFARIEFWRGAGDSFWRVIDARNVTAIYGADAASRIADPAAPDRVYSWLLSRIHDDKGNLVLCDYLPEDDTGIDIRAVHECNRDRTGIGAQRYLKRIRYSAAAPWFADYDSPGPAPALPDRWRHQLVFDYGDHDPDTPAPIPDRPWSLRPDPFSTCRPGFELRSYRRCQRVLVFHDFPEDPACGADCLTRSIDFSYADAGSDMATPSLLVSVGQTGWRRRGGGYLRRSLPPLAFDYARPAADPARRAVTELTGARLHDALDGRNVQLVDLNGDGRPGILERRDDGWTYRENFSPAAPPPTDPLTARFGPARPVRPLPVTAAMPAAQILDVAGNGSPDLVLWQGPLPGLFERDKDGGWTPFVPFETLPRIDFDDPDLRFVDLTGDGRADLMITSDAGLFIHPSRGGAGFDPARHLPLAPDERAGPRLLFSSPAEGEAIHLADMTGDGLSDIVRLRHGQVCYWPNLGHGRFGRRVTMADAPRFGPRDRFDPRRLRLADIDGTGTADLVWIGRDGVCTAANRFGNGFAPAQYVARLPDAALDAHIEVLDLLGRGTAALVWSRARGDGRGQQLFHIDLMPGPKPWLLVAMRNNLGAETRIDYAPSTRFAAEDALAGRPWKTRLPFPVHVVARVETIDHIGRIATSARYAYHDGCYDGAEREFAGFGRVDQWDSDGPTAGANNWDTATWSPPVLTRSWYHTGTPSGATGHDGTNGAEPWQARGLPAPALPPDLSADELREAHRPLRGTLLRSEVFAEDDSARAALPYSVSETCPQVVRLQPRGPNRHAVFTLRPRESLITHYERDVTDPRISHDLVLETDAWNRPLRSLQIAYPRRAPAAPPGLAPAFAAALVQDQSRLAIRAVESRWTNALDDPAQLPHAHRLPLPSERLTYQILGATAPARLSFADAEALWRRLWLGGHDLPPGEHLGAEITAAPLPAGPWRRLMSHERSRYRRDDFNGLLPLGELQALALTGESWTLAFTPDMLDQLLGARVDAALLRETGHVQIAGHPGWWRPSGRVHMSPGDGDAPAAEALAARAHFFMARRFLNPFGAITRIGWQFDLMAVESRDALDNVTRAEIDWRVMQPFRVTDANGNRTEVAYDALARVAAHASRGPEGTAIGGDLTGLDPDPDDAALAAFAANPMAVAAAMAMGASARMVYDPFAFARDGRPPWTARIARERHALGADAGVPDRVAVSISHSDGFGREIQVKTLAEPGPVQADGPEISPRWTCSGWVIHDNKARPIRQYEPFFSASADYEPGQTAGVAITTLYDPVGRAIATLNPDGSWTKTLISPWHQAVWDASDTTALADPRDDADVGPAFRQLLGAAPFLSWRARREAGQIGDTPEARAAEADALTKTRAHAATPDLTHFDSEGRPCLALVDIGGRQIPSRSVMDAGGAVLAMVDGLGRRVLENGLHGAAGRFVAGHDLLGRPIYRRGMDDGERRALPDIRGNPVYAWDAMGHRVRLRLDALGRVTHRHVARNGTETLRALSIYGETAPPGRNLRGRLWRSYDDAGLSESLIYDFTGNLLSAARHLAADGRNAPDWSALDGLATETALDQAAAALLAPDGRYLSLTAYDGLGRAVQSVMPHRAGMRPSVVQLGYAPGGLPQTLDLWLRLDSAPDALLDPATATRRIVRGSRHDARGQKLSLSLGNGVEIRHAHDPQTFRLRHITADRGTGWPVAERKVQDLGYSYDAVGNFTRITDDSDIQNAVFFRNRRVDPGMDFTYDAAYRLVQARGREHLGQAGGALLPPMPGTDRDAARERLAHPGDGLAMGLYRERYVHDDAGNLLRVSHGADSGSWQREMFYETPSLTEAGVTGNRLDRMTASGQPDAGFTHDTQGRMTTMPHLSLMLWDEEDRLIATARQAVNTGLPETTWLSYGGDGARLRKLTCRAAPDAATARPRAEVITLGPIEIRREYAADGITVTLEREILHLDFGGECAAIVETRTQGSDPGPAQLWRFQLHNHQGSATLELDQTGAVISYEEYYPFGGTAYQAVRSGLETPKRQRFLGRERDEESGLYHFGARYYAAWLGRWTSPDPAGLADGTNRYAYAGNDPVGLVDPDGHAGRKAGAAGDVAPHGSQGHRGGINQSTGKAALESEHVWAISHQRESLRNPATGLSPIPEGRGHALDRRQPTVMVDKAAADVKTPGDMAALDAAKAESKAGQITAATAAEMTPEAGLRRLGPNASAGAETAMIGQIDSLHADTAVRDFARHPDNNPLIGATMDQIDAAVDAPASTGQMTTIATEQKPRTNSVFRGNAETAAKAEVKAAATEAKVLSTAAEGAEIAAKTTAKATAKAAAKTALKKLGTKALKVIPFVGMGAGLASATAEAAEGNTGAAALDTVGLVPVLGDVVDAGRLGIAVGETADQLLGISVVAGEYGTAAEGLARNAGMSPDNARIVGGTAAALSAITVAPSQAMYRTVSGWFD